MNSERREEAYRRLERTRRRRELVAAGVAGLVLVSFVLAQTQLPPLSRHTSFASNLIVISLFDLSFLLLGLLLFLVGRNLAKAIFERRRGLIGSRLQARLVFGFIAVAMLPTVFLLYVSGSFLKAEVDSWFKPQYEQVLGDSLQIAQVYYLNSANNAKHFARVLAEQIAEQQLLAPGSKAKLRALLRRRQQEYNLGTIEVFNVRRVLMVLVLSARTPTGIGVSPESVLLKSTLAGHGVTRTDRFGKSDIIRGSAPIYASPDSDRVVGAVVVDYYLPRSLSERAQQISRTFERYFQMRILHQPILHSYFVALGLIGLVVVTLASWFGIYLARGITTPIKLLARGTDAVAAGDLGYRIPPVGDDEIAHLVDSFNRMSADLKASRAELERRRRYTETLLRKVSAGVVALDPRGYVTTINPCAERLLGVSAAEVLGCPYQLAFRPPLARSLEELLAGGGLKEEKRLDARFETAAAETELTMVASPLRDEENADLGTVLFLEDLSHIAKVERMQAWREVARRVAHEIRNPLTPIQLSAERLKRQLEVTPAGVPAPLIDECARVIVAEVEQLKRLVSEFAAFARMPHLRLEPGDLNELAQDAVATFREANPDVKFMLNKTLPMPLVPIDRQALKRALVNLLDNAVAAVRSVKENQVPSQVAVSVGFDAQAGRATLEVSDNGPGVDLRLRTRIFEPYFSTRRGGTGLGLAIVSAIVAEHHGSVRLVDNHSVGSRFVLEIPSNIVAAAGIAPGEGVGRAP